MTLKVMHVVGARPNFMKSAPIMAEMARRPHHFEQVLVHTGQHYDASLSQVFFDQLGMPAPTEHLGVGSGSHAEQTARVMLGFEPLLQKYRPDWVVLVGDVNSTAACALVCAKAQVKMVHVEAGLRSGDRSMPEEINRIVTDQLADLLLTPSPDADRNLVREGVCASRIHCVGNVMIDSLVRILPAAEQSTVTERLGLARGSYILATLHRPSNVDDPDSLSEIMSALSAITRQIPVVFPVHPRTRKRLEALNGQLGGISVVDPLGYVEFLALMRNARLVITDSGGVQEETTFLHVPCLTVRPNTERPVTIQLGTNRLVAGSRVALSDALAQSLAQTPPRRSPIPLWDGRAAERIVSVLWSFANERPGKL